MLRTEYLDIPEYKKRYGTITKKDIQNYYERFDTLLQTCICINEEDEMVCIASTQKPVIEYLILKYKNFILDDDGLKVINGKIVSISGYIPKNDFVFFTM